MEKPNIIQIEALKKLKQTKQKGNNKYLVVLPSGIGKTYLSAFETVNFKGRVLYLVHRREILEQAAKVFKKVHNIDESEIGFYDRYSKNLSNNLIFATIQCISRKKALYKIDQSHFDYIILDEWHHVAAKTYKRVLEYFNPKFLLGMTATPFRFDKKNILKRVKENIPYKVELKYAIEKGFLSPFIYYGLWDNIDYSDIKWKGNKYTERDLNKKLLVNSRDKAIVKEFKKRIKKRICIGFCCSIKHIERCVKKFNKAGIKSVGLSYKTPFEKRRKLIEDFRKGIYQVVFTKDIFNEGVDFPEVEALLFLRPTFSKTIFLQQLGRGLRIKKGKKNVIVLDFIGNYKSAYKIKDWLKDIKPQGIGRGLQKIEYNYSIPKVYFDKRVINLFKELKPATKDDLILDYKKVKYKIGKIPSALDYHHYGKYDRSRFDRLWGSWLIFKRSIGDNTINISKKQIKKQFIEFRNKKGYFPSVRDLKEFSLYSDNTIRKVFGSYANCIYELGGKPRKHTKLDLSKKKIIEDYLKIKEKLGKVPFSFEINKEVDYNWDSSLRQYFSKGKSNFGGYKNFLKIMGDYNSWFKRNSKSKKTQQKTHIKKKQPRRKKK